MKASELKPGQFFEFEPTKERRLCIAQLDDGRCMFVTKRARNPDRQIIYVIDSCCQSLDVTPLNVHGWDEPQSDPATETPVELQRFGPPPFKRPTLDDLEDVLIESIDSMSKEKIEDELREAGIDMAPALAKLHAMIAAKKAESEPAPLQLREGAWYRRRDQKIVGPIKQASAVTNPWPWGLGNGPLWRNDGKFCNHEDSPTDLIAEVPPPVDPLATVISYDKPVDVYATQELTEKVEAYKRQEVMPTEPLHPLEAERLAFQKHYAVEPTEPEHFAYVIRVLSDEGDTEKRYSIKTDHPIDSRILQIAGLILDGGASPELILNELPTAQAYVATDSEHSEGWVTDILNEMSPEQADAEYEAAPAIPISDEEVDSLVRTVAAEPEQFQAGDLVACVKEDSYDPEPLLRGQMYEVTRVNCSGNVNVNGGRVDWMPDRFRRATPAEVAAYKAEHASNVATAIVSSLDELADKLRLQPDADGWIAWGGGECPVDGERLVDVQFWDGATGGPIEAKHYWWGRKSSGINCPSHIVAYRLVPEQPKQPDVDMSIMGDFTVSRATKLRRAEREAKRARKQLEP